VATAPQKSWKRSDARTATLLEPGCNPGRLVIKDELIAKIWGGRIVSGAALAASWGAMPV
jgi:hypothetical protein